MRWRWLTRGPRRYARPGGGDYCALNDPAREHAAGRGSAGVALARRLGPLVRESSPFSDEVPRIDALEATWVAPRLVVEVRSLELTDSHRLRQPAYLGVRSDLRPEDLLEVGDA